MNNSIRLASSINQDRRREADDARRAQSVGSRNAGPARSHRLLDIRSLFSRRFRRAAQSPADLGMVLSLPR